MTGDAELMTGDPHWHNFLPGTSSLGLSFTGVEASGALSRDVSGMHQVGSICTTGPHFRETLKFHSGPLPLPTTISPGPM